MLSKELQKAGLSEKEAKVYLAALELGETTINRIAKKSGVKRSTVYLLIDSLKEKGLISVAKKNKKSLFFAEDPRILEKLIEDKKSAILKAMPELLAITDLIDKKPCIRYFEGHQGIKEVYMDNLNYPGEEICAWFSESFLEFDEIFFYEKYIPARIKNKIYLRAILSDSGATRGLKVEDEKYLRKTKLVPKEKFDLKIEISLYGKDKISIMAYEDEIGLIIQSQKIYDALKYIFEFMWDALE